MPTLHLFTIGQSPRPDLTPEILGWLGEDLRGWKVREAGALDGLSPAAIDRGRAGPAGNPPGGGTPSGPGGEAPLVSRLRSGAEVVLRRDFVEARLEALGAGPVPEDLAAILCTGRFEGASPRLVRAGDAFDAAVAAAAPPGATVGMLVPEARQREEAGARIPPGRSLRVAAGSPYREADALVGIVRRELAAADRIALNCLGYTGAQAAAIENDLGKPVVLARSALAEALRPRLRAG